MEIPANCLHCGVCCHSKSSTYVWVRGDDWSRLGDEADELARFIGNRAYMRMEDGHCIALVIRPRADGGGPEFYCSIYDQRPEVCRDLGRGSLECQGELTTKAQRVADATAPMRPRGPSRPAGRQDRAGG